MANKPFTQLTKDEAKALAKSCVQGAQSEDEIRRRLTAAGFNGAAADVTSRRSGPIFDAMIMVDGPNGEIISA